MILQFLNCKPAALDYSWGNNPLKLMNYCTKCTTNYLALNVAVINSKFDKRDQYVLITIVNYDIKYYTDSN